MNVIRAQNLSVELSGRKILSDINLEFKKGTWTSIVGPNGSGKTTLLQVLAGLMGYQGSVSLPEWELGHHNRVKKAQYLAWMGQHEVGAEDLTVYDVAMLGRLPHRSWWGDVTKEDHQAVKRALDATHAWDWRERSLGELSGGERQRVLLARVLAVESDIVLMDEPLNNLDPPLQVDWLILVKALIAQKKTVVSVLHEVSMALLSDELVVMDQGKIQHHGSVNERLTHEAVERVFDNRIKIQALGGRWVALPVI